MMKVFCNEKFNDKWYTILNGSSMMAYLIHYIFISVFCRALIANNDALGEIAIVIVLYILAEVGVMATYFAVEKMKSSCSKRQDEAKVENN